MKEIKNDNAPPLIDSLPNVGPTCCSATILAGAVNLPLVNNSERSCASFKV